MLSHFPLNSRSTSKSTVLLFLCLEFCLTILDSDSCTDNPCQNNATCYDIIGGHICKCQSGYYGNNCEAREEAAQVTCPDVTCPDVTCPHVSCPDVTTAVPETVTSCPTPDPEPEVDYCTGSPCLNGGTCHNSTDGYVCTCPQYFFGGRCENGNV